jgi:hypothetical protein
MPKSFLGRKDLDVLTDLEHVCEDCAENLDNWKVPAGTLEKMTALTKKARVAFEANRAKATKNATTKAAKDVAFEEMKRYAREFTSLLKFNLNIPNEMLVAMGLPSRDRHRRSTPAPTQKGNIKVVRKGKYYRFSLNLPLDNQLLKMSVPKEATGGTEWRYKKKGAAKEESKYSSKSSFMLKTTDEERGETLLVCGRWINAKYEPGPWSDWIEVIIS